MVTSLTRSPCSQISRPSRSDSMYSSPVIGRDAKFVVRFASQSAATLTCERSTSVSVGRGFGGGHGFSCRRGECGVRSWVRRDRCRGVEVVRRRTIRGADRPSTPFQAVLPRCSEIVECAAVEEQRIVVT